MPAGSNTKREREYNELVGEFKDEGRYKGREEEVAARIVNKQRAEFGETQEAREENRRGESPDRNLPIDNYDHLTVEEVESKLDDSSQKQRDQIRDYEEQHKNRVTLLEALDRHEKS